MVLKCCRIFAQNLKSNKMYLSIIENLIVFYWYLLDIRAFQEFEYWKSAGLQAKYAFEKVYKKL